MITKIQPLPQKLVFIIAEQKDLNEKTLFFHLTATGHYWRNSYIRELQAAVFSPDKGWQFHSYACESEEEEYDLLIQLSYLIDHADTLIGYNSTSFHIPYLQAKYKAYGLMDPTKNCSHLDLMTETRKIAKFLYLSQKLEDLKRLFNMDAQTPELFIILNSIGLLSFRSILSGEFSVVSYTEEPEGIYLQLETDAYLGITFHQRHPLFYLAAEEHRLQLLLKTYDNRLKVFYQNYQDYYYLPDEDMILHKSMATGIAKERRVKASKENCYQYAVLPENLSCQYLEKYLKMLFRQLS